MSGFEEATSEGVASGMTPAPSQDLPPLVAPGEPAGSGGYAAFEGERAQVWRDALEQYRREAAALGSDPGAARLHLEIGRIHEEHLGEARAAADAYQQAYELDSTDPSVLHACRRIFALAGQWEMVATILADEARATEDPERRATLTSERGQVLDERLDDPKRAEQAFVEALDSWPAEPMAIASLERLYAFDARYRELYQVYVRALEVTERLERRVPLLVCAAQLSEDRLDHVEGAAEHYREVLQLDPESAVALSALRRLEHRAGAWESFAEILTRSAEVAKDSEEASQHLLAAARVQDERLGMPEKALASLVKALEFTPRDIAILKEIEALYERNSSFTDVAKVLVRELEVTPEPKDRVPMLFKLGTILEDRLHQADEALGWFAEAVRLQPTHVPARQALGRLYGRTQRWEELADLFRMEIGLEEEEGARVARLYKLAELEEKRLGRPDGALAALQELLGLKPDYQPARKFAERLLLEREDWSALVDLYQSELELTRDEDQLIFLLGRIGVIAEEKAMDLNRAQAAYQRILELRPNHLSAIRTLARIATKQEDWQTLLDMYEREIVASEDQTEIVVVVHRAGVVAEERLQDVVRACAQYEKALSINPTYLPALRSLGRIYAQQEQWSELAAMFERELEVTRSAEQQVALLFRIADIREHQLEDDEAAVKALLRVRELDAENLPALRALATIHERGGDVEELVEVLLAEAGLQRGDKDKALSLIRVAELCEERLDRADRAAELYEEVLRLGHGLDASLRALVRIYSAEGMWNALSRALKTACDNARDDASRAAMLVRSAEVAGDRLHNLDSAADLLEQALELSSDIGVLTRLERVSMARRDWRRAVQVMQMLAERETNPRQFAARQVQIAHLKEYRFDPPESGTEHYQAALEKAPDHPIALRAMEIAYVKAANWEGLATFLRREAMVVKEPRRQAELLRRAAEARELHLEDDAGAAELYSAALARAPDSLPAIRGRRRIAEKLGDGRTVLECIRAEGKATADDARARDLSFEAGRVFQDQFQDVEQAVQAFLEVLERSPDHEPAFRRLEAIELERGNHARVVELYAARAEAITDIEERTRLLLDAGRVALSELQDESLAAQLFGEVLSIDGGHASALVELGPLHFRAQRWDEALDVFHRVLAATRDPAVTERTFKSLGVIYQDHRPDLVRAVQSFQAALQRNPADVDSLRRLARLYRSAKDWNSSVNVLLRLVEVSPDVIEKTDALLEVGRMYEEKLEHMDNAVLAYRKLLELDPGHQEAIMRLCTLYERAQKWDALAEVTRSYVASLPPDQRDRAAPLHMKMAKVFEERIDDEGRAIQCYQAVLDVAPRDDQALLGLARLYGKDKDSTPQAVEAHRRLLYNDPFRVESYHQMHRLFERSGQYDKAFVVAEMLVFLHAADEEEEFYFKEHRAKVAVRAEGRMAAKDHLRFLTHPRDRSAIRPVFEVLSGELGRVFPADLSRYALNPKTDRHTARSDLPARRLADEIAAVLEVPQFDVWVTAQSELDVFLESDKPAALIVGAQFSRRLPDADQRFLLGRALERLKSGHQILDLLQPREVEALLGAVMSLTQAQARPSGDPALMEEMQRRITKGVSREGRRQLEEAAARLQSGPTDVARHRAAAVHTANRAGLTFCNDIEAAIRNVAKAYPDIRPVFRDPAGAADTIGRIAEVRELMAFAVSEEYLQLRARLRYSIES